jgi:sulfate permease, SulP family
MFSVSPSQPKDAAATSSDSDQSEEARRTGSAGKLQTVVRDILGGLAGTGVALPQSMALGVALFVSMGLEPSAGALAGLLGAAALSLTSGVAGATTGMISAPNGPVTMLLTASLASVAAAGVSGDGLLLALIAILLLTGLLQFLLGITGGGQLIKFIPYPAVAGLVTGIGLLMVLSQVEPLSGTEASALGLGWLAVPGLVALATIAGTRLLPRLVPAVPGIISGLLVGIALYHLLVLFAPGAVPASWVVGEIPGLDLSWFQIDFSAAGSLPWKTIVVAAMTLAVLASADCLLTAVVADEATGERHDARRELAAQGIGQALAGLLGGVGGGGTKGSTLVAVKTGGRRWAALASGVTFLVLILFLGPVGQILPVSVLAGVVIFVGLGMVEWNIVHWLRNPQTRLDGSVALLVIATTLGFGLMDGVAVGVLGSVALFLRRLVTAPVIHNRTTGKHHRSLQYRTEEESELLETHGDRIVFVELRGNLFFGTADRLFAEMLPDLDRPVWVIINMRRVQYVDISALHLFRQMIKRLHAHGGHMLYSNVRKSAVSQRKMHKLLQWLGEEPDLPKVKTFRSTDAALEYAENELLAELGHAPADSERRVEADDNDILRHLKPKIREALKSIMRPLSLKRKGFVYNYGEHGDAFYLVLKGEVELRLPTRVYHYKRLGKRGPGSYFGESAFLHPGPRTATAFVTQDVELLVLDRAAIDSLAEKRQREIGWTILYELGTSLAEELRQANSELRRLERW